MSPRRRRTISRLTRRTWQGCRSFGGPTGFSKATRPLTTGIRHARQQPAQAQRTTLRAIRAVKRAGSPVCAESDDLYELARACQYSSSHAESAIWPRQSPWLTRAACCRIQLQVTSGDACGLDCPHNYGSLERTAFGRSGCGRRTDRADRVRGLVISEASRAPDDGCGALQLPLEPISTEPAPPGAFDGWR
jgi:hypothetical protein